MEKLVLENLDRAKYFALFATFNSIKVDQSKEKISLSAPFIVSNDKFLRDAIGQCKKLKLPFRLVGFFQPLNEKKLDSVFLNTPKQLTSVGRGFDAIRGELFNIAREMKIELLYQGFLQPVNEENENENGISETE